MESEWLEIAYINFDEAILHGRILAGVDGFGVNQERDVRITLDDKQKRAVEDLNFKHQQERKALLMSMVA